MQYMLLIYGNGEAFSSVGPETFAEIVREIDTLNQELFETGELVGAYGVADQVNAKMVESPPALRRRPLRRRQGVPGQLHDRGLRQHGAGLGDRGAQPGREVLGVEVRPLMHEANVEP